MENTHRKQSFVKRRKESVVEVKNKPLELGAYSICERHTVDRERRAYDNARAVNAYELTVDNYILLDGLVKVIKLIVRVIVVVVGRDGAYVSFVHGAEAGVLRQKASELKMHNYLHLVGND